MVNPFAYLFYKMYKVLRILDGEDTLPICCFGMTALLLTANLWTVWLFVFKDLSNLLMVITLLISGVFFAYYYTKGEKIVSKFSKESNRSRTIGNIAVLLYVFLTIRFLIWAISFSLSD